MENRVSLYGKIVEFHPYRTIMGCVSSFMMIQDVSDDTILKIKRFLNKQGFEMDNHIGWTLDNGVTVEYSDRHITIGILRK